MWFSMICLRSSFGNIDTEFQILSEKLPAALDSQLTFGRSQSARRIGWSSSSSFPSPILYDEFLHAFHLKVNIISAVFTLALHFFNCLGFLTHVMLTAT